MGYRTIDGLTKYKAVQALIRGEPITSVAKRFGVSRASLYGWLEVAMQSLEDYFQGRLVDREKELRERNKREAGYQRQKERLETKVAVREKQMEKLRARIRELKNRGRPKECVNCGCEKVYKNGFYTVSLDYFREHLEKIPGGQVKVLNFICAACGKSHSVVDLWKNQFQISKKQNDPLPADLD